MAIQRNPACFFELNQDGPANREDGLIIAAEATRLPRRGETRARIGQLFCFVLGFVPETEEILPETTEVSDGWSGDDGSKRSDLRGTGAVIVQSTLRLESAEVAAGRIQN